MLPRDIDVREPYETDRTNTHPARLKFPMRRVVGETLQFHSTPVLGRLGVH